MAESRHLIDFIIKWLGLIANKKALVLKSPVRGFYLARPVIRGAGAESERWALGPFFVMGS